MLIYGHRGRSQSNPHTMAFYSIPVTVSFAPNQRDTMNFVANFTDHLTYKALVEQIQQHLGRMGRPANWSLRFDAVKIKYRGQAFANISVIKDKFNAVSLREVAGLLVTV